MNSSTLADAILVVDDDPDIATNVRDILEDFGYRADVAHDGASALALARDNTYDVALLDFKMPDMDGAVLYEQLKSVQPTLVAIMVTAYAGSDGVQRALDAGTWHVMRKPVEMSSLLELVDQAIGQPIVLLIDDDQDFCASMWQILRDQGFRVALAHNEQTARSVVAAQRFDVVLLDFQLGQTDATEVLSKVCEIEPPPTTIVITAHDEERVMANQLVDRGALCVERKPLDISRLVDRIRAALAGK